MRCRALTLLALTTAAIVALVGPGLAQTGGVPQLRQDGRWLVDHLGRVVLLHGVNAVYKVAPYYPPDDAEGFVAADADLLDRHGFNSVRIGTLFVGIMPEEGVVDAAYLDAWDRVVQLLAERGIYVLFDFHQDMYHEVFAGEGFPGWAVHTDGIPPPSGPTDQGFPINYYHPSTSRAFDHLYEDTGGLWDRFASAWQAVAQRWRDQPYVMGYDLMNEPWPGTDHPSCHTPQGCPVFESFELQQLFEHVLVAIRAVDPDNIVWFEPVVQFDYGARTNLATLDPIEDPGALGLSWHVYCLSKLADPTAEPGCDEQEGIVFDNAEEAAGRMGAAHLNTEFGATDDLDEIARITRLADEHLVGWQYWHYKAWHDPTTTDPAEHSMFEDDGDLSTLKVDKLRLLSRTYPQATAGIPRELSFDPDTGDFRYVFEPREAAGPTEIFVPVDLHYPDGYEVTVDGAHVTSAPNATLLTLVAAAGADEVVVELRGASEAGADRGGDGTGGADGGARGGADRARLPASGGGAAAVTGLALLALAVLGRLRG